MSQPRIHWAGGLEWVDARGMGHYLLGGYPCCCSGDRARRIAAEGTQTWDRARVDCKACLALLAKPGAVVGRSRGAS